MRELLGYSAAAVSTLVAAYEAIAPETLFAHVLDLLPRRSGRVADIGAGTGRDAAWFARQGHEVLAVEPVRAFRDAGRRLHPSERIVWLDDRLPLLSRLRAHGTVDLVTTCAVWQHLPDADRPLAMRNIAAALSPGGLLIMSLRHGPGAADRPVYPIDPHKTVDLAQECGFTLVRACAAASLQAANRAAGVSWTWLALEKAGG